MKAIDLSRIWCLFSEDCRIDYDWTLYEYETKTNEDCVQRVSPQSNRKESFYSSSISLLNCEAVYDGNASFIFYKICYDDIFHSIKKYRSIFLRALTCSGAKLKERMKRTMIDIMIFNGWSKVGIGRR